jgi:precorrin-2 dehydrogenase/sirohydrochlorin ferrochelatase
MTISNAPPMYPIMLNVTQLTIFVVGADAAASDRLKTLAEHGAAHVIHFSDAPPTAQDFAAHAPRLVFISGLVDATRAEVHRLAKTAGALVHAQDHIPLCDFHLPARLRRGKLLVTVSTDGAVAGLSRLVRDHLARNVITEAWAARVDELADARRQWKAEGLTMGTLFAAIQDYVAERGWLSRRPNLES